MLKENVKSSHLINEKGKTQTLEVDFLKDQK
jgi:hypothetical protein